MTILYSMPNERLALRGQQHILCIRKRERAAEATRSIALAYARLGLCSIERVAHAEAELLDAEIVELHLDIVLSHRGDGRRRGGAVGLRHGAGAGAGLEAVDPEVAVAEV